MGSNILSVFHFFSDSLIPSNWRNSEDPCGICWYDVAVTWPSTVHTHMRRNPLDNSTNLYPLLTHTSSWRQISQTTFKGSSVLFWIYFNPTLQVDWKLLKSHMHETLTICVCVHVCVWLCGCMCVCVCMWGSPPNQSMDNLLFRVQIKRGQNVPQKPRHSNPPLTLQFLWAVQTDITTDHQNWIDSIQLKMPKENICSKD